MIRNLIQSASQRNSIHIAFLKIHITHRANVLHVVQVHSYTEPTPFTLRKAHFMLYKVHFPPLMEQTWTILTIEYHTAQTMLIRCNPYPRRIACISYKVQQLDLIIFEVFVGFDVAVSRRIVKNC